MTKFFKFAALGVGLLGVSGFGIVEAWEYAQVARNNVQETVKSRIPTGVEIDRMQVILDKMDQQVGQQKYATAKAQVALEDAETALSRSHQDCEALLTDMRKLRTIQSTATTTSCGALQVGCYKVSPQDVSQVLANKLASWKARTTAVGEQEKSIERQRSAYRELETRFSDWQQKRQLLAHRLEALRARNSAQQAGTELAGSSFDTTDLARAAALADQIEQKLRIVEKQQALSSSPVETALLGASELPSGVEAEVDGLLRRGGQSAK